MKRNAESGVALLSVILVMMLMSALLVGFVALVVTDQQSSGVNRDQTQAYAAAHAGLEKLTADLAQLFTGGNFSPSGEQIAALATDPPDLEGFIYEGPGGTPGYVINAGAVQTAPIAAGPYQGLIGLITPYDITVTARTEGGSEVRMRRQMQTIAVPVFQFGLFSENDLSFHAGGGDFSFGGRVHSNANLFISQVASSTLTLQDRVTAVGEIVRTHWANGQSAAAYNGTIRMARAPNCQPPPAAGTNCRNLAQNEGSLVGNLGSAPNGNWVNLSIGTYSSFIRNGTTGARRLDLPLVSDGASPIDIIRRPPPGAPESAGLANQRYFNMATLRVLLSDSAAEITALPGTVGTPVSLEAAALPVAAGSHAIATSTGSAANGYRSASGTSLVGGFILVNRQDTNGVWSDVTEEVLALGISGRNLSNGTLNTPGTNCSEQFPNAILRLQRLRDTPATGTGSVSGANCNATTQSTVGSDYWPNVLYDPREGLRRDVESTSQNDLYLGGLMHYVELDVNNFRRWITGAIGASGPGSQDLTGYVVYFSDRRGNKNDLGQETGEYGWEDFINTDNVSTPNNTLDQGEDVNGNTTLQTYGNTPQITFTVVPPSGSGTWGTGSPIDAGVNVHGSRVNRMVARVNRAVFYRRALKVVNGGLGSLPSVALQGLTIVSENPVYIEGNFNACGTPTQACASNGFGPTGDAHRSAAVIADAVTLLSRVWNDIRSFNSPHSPAGRVAETTWYRLGLISGKGIAFPFPNNNALDAANYGSDGGAHNFARFIESWTNKTFNYRGSMVSLYFSRQGVGTWKCCRNVYAPPGRGAMFDEEFLTPSLLPPRTPMFRDVNTLTFRQLLRPTE